MALFGSLVLVRKPEHSFLIEPASLELAANRQILAILFYGAYRK